MATYESDQCPGRVSGWPHVAGTGNRCVVCRRLDLIRSRRPYDPPTPEVRQLDDIRAKRPDEPGTMAPWPPVGVDWLMYHDRPMSGRIRQRASRFARQLTVTHPIVGDLSPTAQETYASWVWQTIRTLWDETDLGRGEGADWDEVLRRGFGA